MKFLENTKLFISLSLIVSIILAIYFSLVISYYKLKEIKYIDNNRLELELCLTEAKNSFKSQMEFQCEENNKSRGCSSLPTFIVTKARSMLAEDIAICVQIFKNK